MLGLHVLERWVVAMQELGIARWKSEFASRFWHHFAWLPLLVIGVCTNLWGAHDPVYLFHAITMPRPTMLEWQPRWMAPDTDQFRLVYEDQAFAIFVHDSLSVRASESMGSSQRR